MSDKLPEKYQTIYKEALPYLQVGRPGDDAHALEVALSILKYGDNKKNDFDVLVPVAIMHDIGHHAILPEHFKYITGSEKLPNSKLVHMLTGAKIAKDILSKLGYNKSKIGEIVEIISMHDADQLRHGVNTKDIFNTEDKKFFHDVDSLDRYSIQRIEKLKNLFPNITLQERFELIEKNTTFFFKDIEEIAKERLQKIKDEL